MLKHLKMALIIGGAFGSVSPVHAAPDFIWTKEKSAELEAHIASGDYGAVTSALIISDGAVVFETYANDATADTLHNTRSVGKTITGLAVGKAITDGALSLNTRPAQYFSDLMPFANPDADKMALTVEDLLTMSGPLECDDQNQFSRGNEERMYIVKDWSRFFWNLPARGYPAWVKKPEDSAYGRNFSYCTAGVQTLGETVSRATQTAFPDYVKTMFFAPMGITSFEWQFNGEGQAHMGGGLKLRTRDWAKFGELMQNGGRHGRTPILSEAWVNAAGTPKVEVPNTPGLSYGYLWWLFPYELEGKKYFARIMNGNGGNRVIVLPEFCITAVLTKTDFNNNNAMGQADAFMFNEIIANIK